MTYDRNNRPEPGFVDPETGWRHNGNGFWRHPAGDHVARWDDGAFGAYVARAWISGPDPVRNPNALLALRDAVLWLYEHHNVPLAGWLAGDAWLPVSEDRKEPVVPAGHRYTLAGAGYDYRPQGISTLNGAPETAWLNRVTHVCIVPPDAGPGWQPPSHPDDGVTPEAPARAPLSADDFDGRTEHYVLHADDLARRLCQLQREVADRRLGYDDPNDCFCADQRRRSWGDGFRSQGSAVDFIVAATRAALDAPEPTPVWEHLPLADCDADDIVVALCGTWARFSRAASAVTLDGGHWPGTTSCVKTCDDLPHVYRLNRDALPKPWETRPCTEADMAEGALVACLGWQADIPPGTHGVVLGSVDTTPARFLVVFRDHTSGCLPRQVLPEQVTPRVARNG